VIKSNFRSGYRMAAVVFAAVASLAGCQGQNASDNMSPEEINKLIAPVGQLNTGAPITVAAGAAPAMEEAAPTAAAPEAAAASAPVPAVPAPVAARSGKQVYETTCFACHGVGAAGAPKFGDKAAWAPRISQGMDTLVTHAINGFQGKTGMMPPRGTCANCSDDELKSAVDYMVKSSS